MFFNLWPLGSSEPNLARECYCSILRINIGGASPLTTPKSLHYQHYNHYPCTIITTTTSTRTTCSKSKLPPGIYFYQRANGLQSLMVVKTDMGSFDQIEGHYAIKEPIGEGIGGVKRPPEKDTAGEEAAKKVQKVEEEVEADYEVERVLGRRQVKGRLQYLVKWLGYQEEDNTWEPVQNLSCQDKIQEFEARNGILREDKRLTKQAPNLSQQAAAILKDSLDVSSTFTGYTPR